TPLMLGIDSDTARMVLLVWTIAVAGIILTFLFWGKFKVLRVLLYVVMGWLVVFFWGDIIPFLPQGLFPYVLAGGITYTVGVAFYASKRLPCHHAVWHLFCIGGSVPFFIGFFVKLR
ncbi:MAG TPA: hemolysin III family protein, partial [Sphaerochaeta sp.]|nr:hemolysin III family protein [Sphaerochaeta sp.]